ncbi:MAG: glycoside hydrolase family 1 protein [Chloroflexi bacterium]|nr:glycoside hydrolase family 1 protein [Chloroflexota bacterium]
MKFPDGFLWGAATAAHQVEGGNFNNDWWDWEQIPGKIKNGDTSAGACAWWKGERYRADFDLARSLNHNAHRLSIEWSRIEPREGEWNADAIAFYRRVLGALRERGMTPLVTLHHFSNPRWLVAEGAWETEAVLPLFERFVTRAVQELGDLCDFWITINEPNVYAFTAYINGLWPPGKKDFRLAFRVLANMVRAHATAYHAIHRAQAHARVGIAYHIRALYPANPRSALDRFATRARDYFFNHLVARALQKGKLIFPLGLNTRVPEAINTQDFLGLNYYFSSRIAFDLARPAELFGRQLPHQLWGVSFEKDLESWFGTGDIDPQGFYGTLMWLARYGNGIPIYVTENGIGDARDEIRPSYLVTYLAALQRALRDGANVRGYFHWSLVDNFEWIEGLNFLRFGLIANDFATQTRTPRASAHLLAQIARANAIADELIEKYGYKDRSRPTPTHHRNRQTIASKKFRRRG